MHARKLESIAVGRPPVENPRNVTIHYRVDQSTADALDAEISNERRPGEVLSRNDLARILMHEALEARRQQRGGRAVKIVHPKQLEGPYPSKPRSK